MTLCLLVTCALAIAHVSLRCLEEHTPGVELEVLEQHRSWGTLIHTLDLALLAKLEQSSLIDDFTW